MSNPTRFVVGAVIAIVGLIGLVAAAGGFGGHGGDAIYYVGLAVFGCSVLAVLAMIGLTPRHRHPAVMRDEGPLPLHMATSHGLGAPPPPLPPMPAQGLAMPSRRSPTWIAAAPWLLGGVAGLFAIAALVVASTSHGAATSTIALLVFAAAIFYVFRMIASGGRPERLIPRFVPASPGAAFALGSFFGLAGLIALVSAAQSLSPSGQMIALLVAVLSVLAIFVMIAQSWDRTDRQPH